MASKLAAARFVTNSGRPVLIAWGRESDVLPRLAQGETLGTLFLPQSRGLSPKKRWIGFTAQCEGRIVVDPGAVKAVCDEGRSLLAIGVRDVLGNFEKGDAVSIVNATTSKWLVACATIPRPRFGKSEAVEAIAFKRSWVSVRTMRSSIATTWRSKVRPLDLKRGHRDIHISVAPIFHCSSGRFGNVPTHRIPRESLHRDG